MDQTMKKQAKAEKDILTIEDLEALKEIVETLPDGTVIRLEIEVVLHNE